MPCCVPPCCQDKLGELEKKQLTNLLHSSFCLLVNLSLLSQIPHLKNSALGDSCNTEIDCADKSDENTCDYLKYGRNYAKQLIPRDASGTPVTVYLNVSILAFPGM